MYSHKTPPSPNAIAASSKVKALEDRGAGAKAIDEAYVEYWEVIDTDRREENRLNRIYADTLAREAANLRK